MNKGLTVPLRLHFIIPKALRIIVIVILCGLSNKVDGVQPKEWSDPPPYWCATQTDLSYSLIDSELQVFTRGMVKNNVYVYMEHLRAWIASDRELI